MSMGDAARVLAEVEMESQRYLGSFRPREYDALMTMDIPNGGHLNRVFEQMRVAYTLRPPPSSEASQPARDKRKTKVTKKPNAKRAKTMLAPSKTGLPKR
jgi:hypothetical protein